MARAVELAAVVGADRVDAALGLASIAGRFADGDLASIIDHLAAEREMGEVVRADEAHPVQSGTSGWACLGTQGDDAPPAPPAPPERCPARHGRGDDPRGPGRLRGPDCLGGATVRAAVRRGGRRRGPAAGFSRAPGAAAGQASLAIDVLDFSDAAGRTR